MTPRKKRAAAIHVAMPIILWIVALCSLSLHAQTPVTLSPSLFQQFFTASGVPLANGCLFSYNAGSTTPAATYTDASGTTQNTNPIILSGGGFTPSGIWLASQSYRFVLFSSGGTNCVQGSQQGVIDLVSPPPFLAGNNLWTGLNTFSGTTTFNGLLNTNSGGTLTGSFGGNPNFTGNPNFSGTPTFSSGLNLSFVQSLSTPPSTSGFVRMANADSVCWRDIGNMANVCLGINSARLAIPYDSIQGTSTNGATPILLQGANGISAIGEGVTLAGGNGDSGFDGGNIILQGGTGGAFTFGGNITLNPGAAGVSGVGPGDIVLNSGIFPNGTGVKHQRFTGLCTTGSMTGDDCTTILSWTAPFVDANYSVSCTPIGGGNTPTFDLASKLATSVTFQIITFADTASTYAEVDCIAVHD